MSISKKELVRDMQSFRCNISTIQSGLDKIQKRIDRLPDEPPKHEWKVGDWFWCGHLKAAAQYDDKTGVLTNLDVPIPTPHEIGTWIHGNDGQSFRIDKRDYLSARGDWEYYGERLGETVWHKNATVIPPPKFEVGETVKHIGKILARIYSSDSPTWAYQADGAVSAGFLPELYLTRVPDSPCVGYRTHKECACVPAHFIQTAESTIGEGSIVRTPDGWVGSVVERESNGKWRVWGHGKAPCHGWFTVSELTLCPPEGK